MFKRAFQLFTSRAAALDGKVVFASSRGAVDDADVSLGSSTFGTNNTALLQSILDEAQNKFRVVVFDGRYSVSGLDVWGNTILAFPRGCGLILRNSSNRSLLRNKHPSKTTVTDKNISIYGGILNGNASGQDERWHIDGSSLYNFHCCLSLFGVQNIRISDVDFYKSPSFHFHTANASDVWIDGCGVQAGQAHGTFGYDGFHLNGNCTRVNISKCSVDSQDDAIALNADDGAEGNYFTSGPLVDISVEKIKLVNALRFLRILSKTALVDRITIRDIKGTVFDCVGIIDYYPEGGSPTGTGNMGHIDLDDIRIDGGTPVVEGYHGAHVYINSIIRHLRIANWTRSGWTDAAPGVLIAGNANINRLDLDNIALDDTQGVNAPIVQMDAGSVGDLNITNSYLQRTATRSGSSPALKLTGGTISRVNLSDLNTDWAKYAIEQTEGTIGGISHRGVKQTNAVAFYKHSAGNRPFMLTGNGYNGPIPITPYADASLFKGDASQLPLAYINFEETANATVAQSVTPIIGPAWSIDAGGWTVNNGYASPTADNSYIKTNPAVARVRITVQALIISGSPGFQIFARHTDDSNNIAFLFGGSAAPSQVRMLDVVAGAVVTDVTAAVSLGWHVFDIILDTAKVTLASDGVVLFGPVSYSAQTGTIVRAGNYNGFSTSIGFRSFRVEALP